MSCDADTCCGNPKCDGASCKPTPKREPTRLTMRQARIEVTTAAAEFLAGAAHKCLDDGDAAPEGSAGRSNAVLLARASRELAAALLEGAKKLDRPRVVVPDTVQ